MPQHHAISLRFSSHYRYSSLKVLDYVCISFFSSDLWASLTTFIHNNNGMNVVNAVNAVNAVNVVNALYTMPGFHRYGDPRYTPYRQIRHFTLERSMDVKQ